MSVPISASRRSSTRGVVGSTCTRRLSSPVSSSHRRMGESRADEANRLQKTLESANLKLASVATDVLGMSGRAMFAALIQGQRDPEVLAELARGKLRAKLPQLRRDRAPVANVQHDDGGPAGSGGLAQQHECTQVALESTGVYWRPVVRREALFDREGMKGPLLRTVAAVC
jgi:hypothetical protein